MIAKLLKFFISVIFILLTFVTLTAVFLKFVLLNHLYYNLSFRQNNTYENLSRGIKSLAKDYMINEYSKSSGKDYSTMTLGERQNLETQIDKYTAFINKDSIQVVLEGNINNILNYLNNKSADLYVYFPVDNLGLQDEISKQIKPYFTDDKLSVSELLLKNAATSSDIQIYRNLKNTSKYLEFTLIVCAFSLLFLLFLYSLLSKKGKRFESSGLLLSIDGVVVLILSWILFTAQKIFSEGINYKVQTSEILAGILVPIFLKPLVAVFIIFGIILLFIGILFYNKKEKISL